MPSRRNSAEVYKWFRKDKKTLLGNDYLPELYKRKEPSASINSPDEGEPSYSVSQGTTNIANPTWNEVIAEVKRRIEESQTDDTRTWEEIVTAGRSRWEELKTKQ